MLVFTKSFIDKLGKWLTTPPERFIIVVLLISFIYTHSAIVTTYPVGAERDILHSISFVLYGFPIYLFIRGGKR